MSKQGSRDSERGSVKLGVKKGILEGFCSILKGELELAINNYTEKEHSRQREQYILSP